MCRRFAGLVAQGRSPTEELLADWGTSNCTVGELVDILNSLKLLAAAALLLPGMTQITPFHWLLDGARVKHSFDLKDAVPAEARQPEPPSAEACQPTRLLDNTGTTRTVPSSAPTQMLLESNDPEPTGEPS